MLGDSFGLSVIKTHGKYQSCLGCETVTARLLFCFQIPGAPSNLSGGQFDPSKLGRMEEQPPLAPSFMQQPHLKHSMQNSATPSPPRRQMASFRSYKTGQMPWARKAPVSFAKPSTPHKPVSNTSIPQDKLHDLYNTFKDDMQKMNERTFARANGVKVCKVS